MATSRTRALVHGLVALAALVAVIVGVPLWLHGVAGSPVPNRLPSWYQVWSELTGRDDGTLLLGLLKYAAWAGWALFVASVIADLAGRIRGLPAPRLGPQQRLASQLVGAVLALAVSVPHAMPAVAAAPPTAAGQPAVASAAAFGGSPMSSPELLAADADGEHRFEEYRVRRGDCLWDIAWNELGEPERWPEIYQASRTLRQPDGRRLTDPDLIVTGWVLHIPAPTVETADTHEGPTPAAGAPAETPTPPERTSVATPLFGPASDSPHADIRSDAQWASWQPIATALKTPPPAMAVSAVEERWMHALADHDGSAGIRRDWRSHLTDSTG